MTESFALLPKLSCASIEQAIQKYHKLILSYGMIMSFEMLEQITVDLRIISFKVLLRSYAGTYVRKGGQYNI